MMFNSTITCPHCSGGGVQVIHNGPCPRVKAIEYFPDGTPKRVEFHGERLPIPGGPCFPIPRETGYVSVSSHTLGHGGPLQ